MANTYDKSVGVLAREWLEESGLNENDVMVDSLACEIQQAIENWFEDNADQIELAERAKRDRELIEGHDVFERGMAQKYPVRDRYGDVD